MYPSLDSFRPKPFYFLTTSDPAEYSDEAIRAALLEVKECGFGGIVFFNKPPTGFTEKEYLSDFWFEVSEKFIINCLDLEYPYQVMRIVKKTSSCELVFLVGVSETIRTSGQRLRRPLLYPAELQTHILL